MHYRHRFHAGNFADVFKHVLLVGLLDGLSRKPKPWSYLDTHAGAGAYRLDADAEQAAEWRDGIARLEAVTGAPPMVERYRALVAAARIEIPDRAYPGSPALALAAARPDDRLVLCEKLPEVAEALKAWFRGRHQAAIHQRDGYETHALLPPPEKRGLVLIDPPFEAPGEFERVAAFIARAVPRYAGGVFAAWYPIKQDRAAGRFLRQLARAAARPVLALRLDTGRDATPREVFGRSGRRLQHPMTGCGLAVVNPPFGFAADAEAALTWLAPRLAQGPYAAATVEEIAS